ncbi:MAG: hypothetical protein AAF631_05670 [Pseudomonadota bacterium]
MMLESESHGATVVLRPRLARLCADALPQLETRIADHQALGGTGVILDLGAVGRVAASGLGLLAELSARWHGGQGRQRGALALAVCGLSKRDTRALATLGLDQVLPIFPSPATALNAEMFRAQALSGVRVLFLQPHMISPLGPLGRDVPFPMVDFLGRPVIDRWISHAARFGARDIFASDPISGGALTTHMSGRRDVGVLVASDPGKPGDRFARWHRDFGLFDGDTILITALGIGDVDLAALLRQHRATGAAVTHAMGPDGTLGIAVIAPEAAQILAQAPRPRLDQAAWNRLARLGLEVRGFMHRGVWLPLGSGRQFMASAERALTGHYEVARPSGREIAPGVWAAQGADLPARLTVEGCAHIGAGARLHPGCHLAGPVALGPGTLVENNTFIRHSILTGDCRVRAGTPVDGMIAGPNWAFLHSLADGPPLSYPPLEGVEPMATQRAEDAAAETALTLIA